MEHQRKNLEVLARNKSGVVVSEKNGNTLLELLQGMKLTRRLQRIDVKANGASEAHGELVYVSDFTFVIDRTKE